MEETQSDGGAYVTGSVKNTLKQVVEHFSQPVHVLDEVAGDIVDGSIKSRVLRPPAPTFDSSFEREAELSPIVRFWLDQLSSASTTQWSYEVDAEHILEWIHGYEVTVRPLLLESTDGCVRVLQQYELILSEWLRRIAHRRSNRFSREVGELDQVPTESQPSTLPSIELLPQLSRSIEILATDVTLMTSERLFPAFTVQVRSNLVLPTLLRILDRVLEAQVVFTGVEFGSASVGSTSCLNVSTFVDTISRSLRRCVVSLLAFEGVYIAPPDVAPALAGGLDRGGIGSLCHYPPNDWQQHEVELLHSSFFSLKSIDWTTVTLSASIWNDPDTELAARAAESVWSQLGSLLLDKDNDFQGACCIDDRNAGNIESATRSIGRQKAIVAVLGINQLIEDVRKHFFGRDMLSWEPQLHVSQQVILGRRVTKSRPVVAEKPFQAVPSRIAVAMNFLRLLDRTDRITVCSTRDITKNFFPICATLLDSTSATDVALGASGMLELVEFLDESTGLNQNCSDRGHEGGEMEIVWKTFVEDALPVLERAFQATHEGPVVVAIGQAQSRLLNNILRRNDSRWDSQRRRITGHWLFRLQRSSYRPATQSQCWELLVGGVVPLLLQHARNEMTAADSMEMGRQGLSALLPLIDGEFFDDKTRVASLVALINLLFGAYPIMPHHGGKIVCHLLAAIASVSGENEDNLIHKSLAVHAAAVAVVICGRNFTDDVLGNIGRNRDQYKESLVRAALLVRAKADVLQQEYVD